jgi:hypothetical protein
MTQHDLLEWTRRQPFIPFRLHVLDGRTFDIRHSEMCMPTSSIVVIGLPRDPAQPIAERSEFISLEYIVRIEPLMSMPAST